MNWGEISFQKGNFANVLQLFLIYIQDFDSITSIIA